MNKPAIDPGTRFSIQLAGAPSTDCGDLSSTELAEIRPASIPNIKPKLLVKEGDKVKVGTPLFFDKQDEKVQFPSPVAGTITEIVFGERRVLEAIRFKRDAKLSYMSQKGVDFTKLDSEGIRKALIEHGLWSFFRCFPFNAIPASDQEISSIYLSIDDDEPYTAQSQVILDGKTELLKEGVQLLKALSQRVTVSASNKNPIADSIAGLIDIQVEGEYPANQPGTVMYHHKSCPSDHHALYISLQNLLLITEALKSGKFPTERVITVAGPSSRLRKHLRVPIGTTLKSLGDKGVGTTNTRHIIGGVLTGEQVADNAGISYFDSAVNLIQDKPESEFMSFVQPGLAKQSYSHSFLSALFPPKEPETSASIQGSLRDCISCGHCNEVCPVEILPQYLLRELEGDDVETAMTHGLLDCTSCGLCTYVCPSKIELSEQFTAAKAVLRKEAS